MKKAKLNAYGFILLAVVFFISVFSGIVLWLVFPGGSGFGEGRGLGEYSFLSLSRRNFIDIHNFSSLVFLGLVFVHIAFHWNWIKNLPKLIKN
jgi:hypothetical protein